LTAAPGRPRRARKERPGKKCRAEGGGIFHARALKSRLGRAEATFMRPKTRLDPVVELEERNEERRLREMADASRKARSAEEALVGAQAAARADHRRRAPATDWMLAESAHARALNDVRAAEQAVKSAAEAEGASRKLYTAAHSKAEALRRVAQARVDEILTERAKAETRELDDAGLLQFNTGGPRAA
jgi:hypothetical protein